MIKELKGIITKTIYKGAYYFFRLLGLKQGELYMYEDMNRVQRFFTTTLGERLMGRFVDDARERRRREMREAEENAVKFVVYGGVGFNREKEQGVDVILKEAFSECRLQKELRELGEEEEMLEVKVYKYV